MDVSTLASFLSVLCTIVCVCLLLIELRRKLMIVGYQLLVKAAISDIAINSFNKNRIIFFLPCNKIECEHNSQLRANLPFAVRTSSMHLCFIYLSKLILCCVSSENTRVFHVCCNLMRLYNFFLMKVSVKKRLNRVQRILLVISINDILFCVIKRSKKT